MLKLTLTPCFFILFFHFLRYNKMKFFIISILLLFVNLGFSQENLQHKVQKGETLYSISKKYNVSISDLEQLNPTVKKGLLVHTVLQISSNKEKDIATVHEVIAKETLFGLSKKYNLSIEKLKELNPIIETEGLKIGQILQVSNSKKNLKLEKAVVEKRNITNENTVETFMDKDFFHVVLPKETKYRLSKKYNISISELEKLNPQIKNELVVGTRLVIRTSEKNEKEIVAENSFFSNEKQPISMDGLSKIESVIATASNNIGTKYRSGGTNSEGFDCSGLMFSSFKVIDITLPRTSSEQAAVGFIIDKSFARKGDLIFFATGGSNRINHVGLITEVSEMDIKFIHSSTSSGVIVSSMSEEYYNKRFVQINRVIAE